MVLIVGGQQRVDEHPRVHIHRDVDKRAPALRPLQRTDAAKRPQRGLFGHRAGRVRPTGQAMETMRREKIGIVQGEEGVDQCRTRRCALVGRLRMERCREHHGHTAVIAPGGLGMRSPFFERGMRVDESGAPPLTGKPLDDRA